MSKNIEININNGDNSYEVLYPKTLWGNVENGKEYVDNQVDNIKTDLTDNINKITDWKLKTTITFNSTEKSYWFEEEKLKYVILKPQNIDFSKYLTLGYDCLITGNITANIVINNSSMLSEFRLNITSSPNGGVASSKGEHLVRSYVHSGNNLSGSINKNFIFGAWLYKGKCNLEDNLITNQSWNFREFVSYDFIGSNSHIGIASTYYYQDNLIISIPNSRTHYFFAGVTSLQENTISNVILTLKIYEKPSIYKTM